jgi:hypothetical protein
MCGVSGNILDGFKLICELKADLSGMRGSLQKRRNPHGTYWTLQYELCLEFGGVELIAYLEWKEKVSMLQLHLGSGSSDE